MAFTSRIAENSEKFLRSLPSLSPDELEYWVQHHNAAYFVRNEPEISDDVFDKLVETLRMVKPDAAVLERIGSDQGAGHKATAVQHREPMLSLDKCYDDVSFLKFREKLSGRLVAMPKIDGVACSIIYDQQGFLRLAATRGDGEWGENITENVKRIQDVPVRIDPKVLSAKAIQPALGIEVRGEVHMKLSRFRQKYAEEFANPRNLAAGAIKQKEAEKSENYGLSFFPYDIRNSTAQFETEKFEILHKLGFGLPQLYFMEPHEDVKAVVRSFFDQRESLDYEIDGVVFRADSVAEQIRLGETAHHPRFAIAYKFQGESAQTHVENVEWSVGRSGAVTPVAVVQPVIVSGATVTRASLHNLRIFSALGLSQGALVEIVRRGGVIPHVERLLRGALQPFVPPSVCPSCNQPVLVDGDFLRCTNSRCPAVLLGRFLHYCSVLEIEGFGEKWVKTLIERNMIQRLGDLYRLKLEDLLSLDRMGEKLAQKMITQVQSKRQMDLATFLTALGFDEVGPTVAAALSHQFATYSALMAASTTEIASIFGIGLSIAGSLQSGLLSHQDEIKDLLEQIEIVTVTPIALDQKHPLFGKKIVFTGKMAHLERQQAQKRARMLGALTPGAVTQQTDLLVIGDSGSPLLGEGQKSSKHKEAEKWIQQGSALRIISETEFLHLLNS